MKVGGSYRSLAIPAALLFTTACGETRIPIEGSHYDAGATFGSSGDLTATTGGDIPAEGSPDTGGENPSEGDGTPTRDPEVIPPEPTGLLAPGEPTDAGCDFNGHWIVVQRTKTVGLGGLVVTLANNTHYWEVAQDGDDVQVIGGLNCGMLMKDISDTALAQVTVPDAFNRALRDFAPHTGRTGTVTASDEGCRIDWPKHYIVVSVTPEYLDPTLPLPRTQAERATHDQPGWQDWDQDGKPGVTLVVNGAVSGEMHLVQRDWSEYTGPVDKHADKLRLQVASGTEQVSLPSSTLDDPGNELSSDSDDHFAMMYRVSESEITRDAPRDTCNNVLALARRHLPEVHLE